MTPVRPAYTDALVQAVDRHDRLAAEAHRRGDGHAARHHRAEADRAQEQLDYIRAQEARLTR